VILLAGLCAGLAMAALATSTPDARRRLRSVAALPVEPTSRPSPRGPVAVAVVVVAALGGGATFGLLGLLAGTTMAAAALILRPRATPTATDPAELAMAVDLLAGCVAAGASVADGLDAVTIAAGPALAAHCRSVASALRAGTPVAEAWAPWLVDPVRSPIARSMIRSGASGAAIADELQRAAERLRARRRARAQQQVRRASVWLVLPLGLCFLPAFVLVAVVPLVIGLVPSLH